jgi:hypothetical protein
MRKMVLVVLMLLAAVGPLGSQTATQSPLSNDSIEIIHAKLRLGMTEAEVAEKLSGAEISRGPGSVWIVQQNGSVIQFENGKLVFATRAWSNESNDIVDALFGVVSYFNSEGDKACSVFADNYPDPSLSDEKLRISGQRVRISCGDKSIVISKDTINGQTFSSVTEALGKRKRHSEDKPQ